MTELIKPKYKEGDRVRHKRSGKIYSVVDCHFFQPIATHAFKVKKDGMIEVSPTTIAAHWQYKLDDSKSWRHAESLLELIIG